MKYLKDIDFKNKRVLLRTDFNVPLENGKVKDDWRIRAVLPTIKYILKQPKSKIVIISHLGRPEGKIDPKFSLRPVAKKLGEIIGRKIVFIEDMLNNEGNDIIRSLGEGEIALAENIRFYPEEEKDDENFAINLCHHFGVFVNDAFSATHRAHATVAQIPRFKPSCAGLLMEKEIDELSKALKPPKRPSIAVIGGAKIETKLPLIESLADIYDVVLVGGRVAVEAQEKKIAFKQNVVFPDDYIDGTLDIGPKTTEKYKMAISAASFLVWNGPMGKFEEEKYRKGTEEIYAAIISSDAYKIAGGGESVEFINSQNGADKFDFISSGGGAMLEFLSGKKLPGIVALENNL
ncbi:MAG: phosphoglycerate kinase [Candidatus Moranbacteria bacterium]|nr:phosphoglycerate kinase [Candidatus Moranbacteria bacterium]